MGAEWLIYLLHWGLEGRSLFREEPLGDREVIIV